MVYQVLTNSLNILEEEALTLLSGSESSIIINIKYKISMHSAMIFKKQSKFKKPGLRVKGLAKLHYSMQHIEGYALLYNKNIKQGLHSSIIQKEYKYYCRGIMNTYYIRDKQEQKEL
jgi:hypothetical protein